MLTAQQTCLLENHHLLGTLPRGHISRHPSSSRLPSLGEVLSGRHGAWAKDLHCAARGCFPQHAPPPRLGRGPSLSRRSESRASRQDRRVRARDVRVARDEQRRAHRGFGERDGGRRDGLRAGVPERVRRRSHVVRRAGARGGGGGSPLSRRGGRRRGLPRRPHRRVRRARASRARRRVPAPHPLRHRSSHALCGGRRLSRRDGRGHARCERSARRRRRVLLRRRRRGSRQSRHARAPVRETERPRRGWVHRSRGAAFGGVRGARGAPRRAGEADQTHDDVPRRPAIHPLDDPEGVGVQEGLRAETPPDETVQRSRDGRGGRRPDGDARADVHELRGSG